MSDICRDCKYWTSNKEGNPKWGKCHHPKCLRGQFGDGLTHTDGRYYNIPACKTRFERRADEPDIKRD